jgi:nicotinamide mononucleotide transporter
VLALQKGFYGEVLTTLYFTIMQPIGLLVWIYQAQFKKEQQEFVARKLDTVGWTKYLSISILWWLTFGFIYLINSLVGWYQWSKAAKKA